MNLLCSIGIGHDWEILENINEGKLEQYLEGKYFDNFSFRSKITNKILQKKKCSRCGKEIDEIGEYIKYYIEKNKSKPNI
jgi:hypothetical protein